MRHIKRSKIRSIVIVLTVLIFSSFLLLSACRKNDDIDMIPDEMTDTPVIEEIPVGLEEFKFTYGNFPRMDGSPATVPLAQAVACVLLGESRENTAEMARFTRTTQAFRNIAAGDCDILIVSEPVPGITDEYAEQGFSVEMIPIAIDALVFIVNSSNPIENLTTNQIKNIYTGNVTNWQQVGGDNIEITAFQRNEEAGSQVVMQKLIMDWQPMAAAPVQTFSTAYDMGDSITAIKGFDGSEGAIGYTMLYYADEMKIAEGLKILSVNGVKPDTETIADGTYPLLNPYYAVINADEPGDALTRIMFNWLLSDAGQSLIRQEGYVPLVDSREAGSVIRPEMRWNVIVDDSELTPFTSPHLLHSRISEGGLNELVPSDNYGIILPYSSAVTMNDGSLRVSKYGFVTGSGTVITDLMYDNIMRAYFISLTTAESRPAYHLQINIPDVDSYSGFRVLNAACASDGSWITPFEYINIVFSGDVIFLMRDHESFDIDVYDYNGRRLYNFLDLEWASDISEDTWSEMLVYGVSEGYGFVRFSNDTYGLVNVLTGEVEHTEFTGAFMFSSGLAAVMHDSDDALWGFVNKELETVIPPGYVYETAFIGNMAIVETPEGNQHIINKQGEILYSVTPDQFIFMYPDGKVFSVHFRAGWDLPRFFTADFIEVEHPADESSIGPDSAIRYLGENWFFCMTDEGMWIFTRNNNALTDAAYLIPPDRHMNEFINGYLIYNEYNYDFTETYYGVMLLPDEEIIPPLEIASITPAVHGDITYFMLNTNLLQGSFINDTYKSAQYKLSGNTGRIIKTDPGILSYDEVSGFFYIQGTDHFAWMDKNGSVFISIPSMAYSFD